MEAQSNRRLTDGEAQMLRVGGSVEGIEPGINRPRWEFWRKSLEFLVEASDGRVREIMEQAVEDMIELEEGDALMRSRRQKVKDWLARLEVDDEQSADDG